MNRISITGRITKDLELRKTSTGKEVLNYTLAVTRDKDNTDFIPCTTFGESAKTLKKYCSKGDLIGVEGKLMTNTYTDSSNNNHITYYVITDRVDFLNTSKKESKSSNKSVDKVYTEDIVITEDDLPF